MLPNSSNVWFSNHVTHASPGGVNAHAKSRRGLAPPSPVSSCVDSSKAAVDDRSTTKALPLRGREAYLKPLAGGYTQPRGHFRT